MARHHQKHDQHPKQVTAAGSSVDHKRYELVDLLRQCDFDLPESPEIVLWRDAPAVGAEVVSNSGRLSHFRMPVCDCRQHDSRCCACRTRHEL